jgi:hypothetical protein
MKGTWRIVIKEDYWHPVEQVYINQYLPSIGFIKGKAKKAFLQLLLCTRLFFLLEITNLTRQFLP